MTDGGAAARSRASDTRLTLETSDLFRGIFRLGGFILDFLDLTVTVCSIFSMERVFS